MIEGRADATGGGISLYVNGEEVGTSAFTHPYIAGTANTNVGTNADATNQIAVTRGGYLGDTPAPGIGEVKFYDIVK